MGHAPGTGLDNPDSPSLGNNILLPDTEMFEQRVDRERQLMGREVVVAITGGKLDFGPWEQIFYGEFDGRRKKRVLVKIIGE
jgi:hypothetical protein